MLLKESRRMPRHDVHVEEKPGTSSALRPSTLTVLEAAFLTLLHHHAGSNMETLDGTEWDVVIADTGFASSLLALSLSRSGKRILHLDQREYYGGDEAALSLSEAETWVSRHAEQNTTLSFSHASATRRDVDTESKLSSSRAYSIALAPHLIYARANLVPALVSSQCHNQLDFQAVGSWFISNEAGQAEAARASLVRVPSSREDVFQDSTLDLKARRSLMNFLRFVSGYESQPERWQHLENQPFPDFLHQKFGLSAASHAPILALTMSQSPPTATSTGEALLRIARHLRSIGVFGPGFGAVLPKWGGLAEISQVACRACAVGGGVYVLNKAIKSASRDPGGDVTSLELDNGEKITTTWVCGSEATVRSISHTHNDINNANHSISRSISIVSSPLSILFPPTSEGGVTPAGAVVVVPAVDDSDPPVHIFVHTSEAGECPMDQSVVYASVALPHETGRPRLEAAVSALLSSVDEQPNPDVLWSLQFQQRLSEPDHQMLDSTNGFVSLPALSSDVVLEDSVLDHVKEAWKSITGEDEATFMTYEAREGLVGDD